MRDSRAAAENEREILKVLHRESRHYVAPIHWASDPADAASVLHNGSCFAVQVAEKIFAVTAAHVLRKFREDSERAGEDFEMRIRDLPVDVEERLIDCDYGLDIATFRLSRSEAEEIGIRLYSCSAGGWPPPPPQKGKGVVVTGYPGERRKATGRKTLQFEQVSNVLVVTDIGRDFLEMQVREEDLVSLAGEPVPPIDMDVGGFSGAPVWTVSSDPHELWRLAGIIYKTPRKLQEDGRGKFAVLIARRPDCIRRDGTLKRPYVIS